MNAYTGTPWSIDHSTAALSVVYGLALESLKQSSGRTEEPDARTARELAIISRVLEKRLSDRRRLFACGAPAGV